MAKGYREAHLPPQGSALDDGRPRATASDYSIVDSFLLVLYRSDHRIGLPMDESCPAWTGWTGWTERMLERPAVQRVFEREVITVQ